jgi:manganese-dependent ADP-ribose/CDP-alcohol diphosphatase
MNRRQFLAISSAAATCASRAGAQSTPEKDSPIVSFGLMTDVQYADVEPQGERHYRESIPKLKAAVADLAGQKLPFSLHLGDVIDRDFSSFATILPLFTPLGHPVKHLLGNHDFSVKNEMKNRVTATLGMPQDYYAFRHSGVCFIMMDTNDVSTYKYPQGSKEDLAAEAEAAKLTAAKAAKAQPWNGAVSAAQLEWLEKQLAAADEAKEPAIVCGHHPLLPANGHQVWNDGALSEILGRHPSVRAYFCGHVHSGAEAVVKGVPFITFKSILQQPDVNAYSVVRLFKDRLVIEGRGREKSREIAFSRA